MEAVQNTRTVVLNLLPPTATKEELLLRLRNDYRGACQHNLEVAQELDTSTQAELQEETYDNIRERYGFQSQVAIDTVHQAHEVWKANNGKEFKNHPPIRFNTPRSGKIATTDRDNPVAVMATYTDHDRIAIPIQQDGAYHRLQRFLGQGYNYTQFRLAQKRSGDWCILLTLKKEFPVYEESAAQTVLGIDIGTNILAAITVRTAEGKNVEQHYYGQDLCDPKRDIGIRRSKLRRYADKGPNSPKARKKLRKLREYETDLTHTRCYQIAHQLVDLAKQHRSIIVLENLEGLRDAEGSRKSNRKNKRAPYSKFREAVEAVATRNGVPVEILTKDETRNTSQECSRCGKKGSRSEKGYFACNRCGYEANDDRNASANVARRYLNREDTTLGAEPVSGPTSGNQSPKGELPVSGVD